MGDDFRVLEKHQYASRREVHYSRMSIRWIYFIY